MFRHLDQAILRARSHDAPGSLLDARGLLLATEEVEQEADERERRDDADDDPDDSPGRDHDRDVVAASVVSVASAVACAGRGCGQCRTRARFGLPGLTRRERVVGLPGLAGDGGDGET